MGFSQRLEQSSPLTKRNPELACSIGIETNLLFVIICPEVAGIIPWSIVFSHTPWVSHFDEFVNTISVFIGETMSLDETIGMS
jgi:hypothetical protein